MADGVELLRVFHLQMAGNVGGVPHVLYLYRTQTALYHGARLVREVGEQPYLTAAARLTALFSVRHREISHGTDFCKIVKSVLHLIHLTNDPR